ncbi:MAG: ABC transporter ATP-binding protein [Verrucomicrobia bacterium]|nr:ABC transporter ATP-binding protein [Verrucomicrobiota bacterium]MCH8510824.1 ABC transporter ATP-binding protein [Kiritimatiellia bacterium]
MIEFQEIAVRQGGFTLSDVNFTLPEGAYGVMTGKTGCGKTTLLEILCGLRRPHSGAVRLFGQDVTRHEPGSRGIGYVPQDQALFPHLSVRENLAFALRIRRWSRADIATRVGELAERLGIQGLLDREPGRLSGGEAQRVALGRALAPRPRVLCLDEPLSALDEDTHEDLLALLRGLHRTETPTVLHITHRRSEADRLATHRLRLANGALTLEDVSHVD